MLLVDSSSIRATVSFRKKFFGFKLFYVAVEDTAEAVSEAVSEMTLKGNSETSPDPVPQRSESDEERKTAKSRTVSDMSSSKVGAWVCYTIY